MSAEGMKDTELALLRARFDLRLDVERARTQEGAAEMRSACDQATQAQQGAIDRQVAALRKAFEQAEAVQHSVHEAALSEARAEARRESEHLAMAAQEKLWHWQRTTTGLEHEVEHWQRMESEEKYNAMQKYSELTAEMHSAHGACEREQVEVRSKLEEKRQEDVAAVISRFELDHFDLSVRLEKEAESRRRAEQEVQNWLARFQKLRQHADEALAAPDAGAAAKSAKSFVFCGTQTDPEETITEPAPLSPRHERLALYAADVESRLWHAALEESRRLRVVEERTRCAVALKNDMIDGLKDELWQKEREILEARGILAGLHMQGGLLEMQSK